MRYPSNKTKIICTIGPASNSPEIIDALLRAGMNVARLNFSHGDFNSHAETIKKLKIASKRTGHRLAIMADLPGPKMRIGKLIKEPIYLQNGDSFTLTTEQIIGDHCRVSVTFKELAIVVKAGDKLFLNDGLISLLVKEVTGSEVCCEVRSGGELRSRKGLNLPGIDLGRSAFTLHDRDCLEFALNHGVDAVSQSFVTNKEDIVDLKKAVAEMGYNPFIIAKIERAGALENLDEIIQIADGIMIARGDLAVETDIASMAIMQKQIMRAAAKQGKPIITATQMLESMTEHRRPTRAEATDVANAILDGTDGVMLSGESAIGRYPVEAVAMLTAIAANTEPQRQADLAVERLNQNQELKELIAHNLHLAIKNIHPQAVIILTRAGNMARNVTKYRLPVWITAFSTNENTCQTLQFSYGVLPVKATTDLTEWTPFFRNWFKEQQLNKGMAILAQGPAPEDPYGDYHFDFLHLKG